MHSPEEILRFWREAGYDRWFGKDEAFDASCRRFEAAHFAAARRALDDWLGTPESALALVLLLDQFPRNFWRGSAHAWATDPLARRLTDRAVSAGHDQAVPLELRLFFYLPFEHSEDMADQERSVALNRASGDAEALKWALVHHDIISRFGRFPHRNGALGRDTTPEEQAFLDAGGFGG